MIFESVDELSVFAQSLNPTEQQISQKKVRRNKRWRQQTWQESLVCRLSVLSADRWLRTHTFISLGELSTSLCPRSPSLPFGPFRPPSVNCFGQASKRPATMCSQRFKQTLAGLVLRETAGSESDCSVQEKMTFRTGDWADSRFTSITVLPNQITPHHTAQMNPWLETKTHRGDR